MSILPGHIRQIGYVVDDLDRAITRWVQLGVGPWFVMRGLSVRALYRGEPCEVTQSIALSNSGDLQVELIQQDDDTPSIFTEFLSTRREGFHQVAYWATDYDAAIAAVREAGWATVWSGGEGLGVRFAYLQPPDSPVEVVEISELTDTVAAMGTVIRDAAAGWDGSDPVRVLGG